MRLKLWQFRHLLLTLVRRQYQLRYRQSLVGVAWAVLPPLASLGVAVIAFHKVIGVNAPGTTSYALFTLAALTPWSFFASAIGGGVPSVITSPQMVQRLAFPRAVLPLSVIGVSLIDLGISAAGFVVFAYLIGAGLPLTAIWSPVILLIEVALISGVCLLGSALNVFARDIRLAVPLVTQLWLFLTPVMYPLTTVPRSLRAFYLANPMTGLVESFRRVLVFGQSPDIGLLLPALIGAIGVLVVGTWYFGATESRFADVV